MKLLEDEFNDIAVQTYDKLREMEVDRFTARLISLPFEYKEEHKEFFQQIRDELEKESMKRIWSKLSEYWNFLNYTLLENLIRRLGDHILKQKMNSYLNALKEFQSSTRLCDFAECCQEVGDRPSEADLKMFVLNLKLEWETCTLEQLEELKGHIIRKFLLPSFTIILKKVSHGSLIIVWLLPAQIASSLIETLENIDTREFCKEHGIESITIDDKECKYSASKKHSVYLKGIYSNKEGKNLAPFKLVSIHRERSKWNPDDVVYKQYDMNEERVGQTSILWPYDETEPRLILIEGAPGVGKTTFSEQFCYKWSQGQRLKDHILLVLLSLRNNRVRSAKRVSDLFYQTHLQQAIAQEVESSQGEGVALLLEGWDELEEEMRKSSIFLDLVCGHVLPKATIIVTSRPWASKTIVESSDIQLDQHIGIITTPTLEFNRVLREKKVDSNSRSKFIDYITSNCFIKAAMHTPVTANMVVEVFQWSQDTESSLPTTMTQLYISYTCKLLTQHFSTHETHRKELQKIGSLKNLPADVQKQLQAISLLAVQGIVKQKLTFSSADTVKETLGLMEEAEDLYGGKDGQGSKHFIHLTLQEFLAAYHISQLPLDKQQEIIGKFIRLDRLKVVLQFYFGICKYNGSTPSMISEYLKFGEYYDSKVSLWIHEINDPKFTRKSLQSSQQIRVIASYEWSLLDYYRLGYIISYSLCEWLLQSNYPFAGNEAIEMMCKGMMECEKEIEEKGREIYIEQCFFSEVSAEGIEWLIKMPRYILQRIAQLDFSIYNKLDKKALDLLSRIVPALPRLNKLYLSFNPIGKGGAVELMRAFKTPLKKLKLIETSLGEEDIKILCEVLANNYIQKLGIDGPTISIMRRHIDTISFKTLKMGSLLTVDDCASLGSLLQHPACQLSKLDIAHCDISSAGVIELAAGLSQNKSVVKFDMCNNEEIGDIGAGALGDMLRKNAVLRELHLRNCGRISSQGCAQLAGGVRKNSTLQVLDLSWTILEEDGADLIIASLQKNETLRELILGYEYIRAREQVDPRVHAGDVWDIDEYTLD